MIHFVANFFLKFRLDVCKFLQFLTSVSKLIILNIIRAKSQRVFYIDMSNHKIILWPLTSQGFQFLKKLFLWAEMKRRDEQSVLKITRKIHSGCNANQARSPAQLLFKRFSLLEQPIGAQLARSGRTALTQLVAESRRSEGLHQHPVRRQHGLF